MSQSLFPADPVNVQRCCSILFSTDPFYVALFRFMSKCIEFQESDGGISLCSFKRSGCAFFITILWVISWFVKIELKQIYCSFSRNKNIQDSCLWFLLLFLKSILLLNRNKNIGNDLFVFHKFPFPSTFHCPPAVVSACLKRSIVANKAHFLKLMFPSIFMNSENLFDSHHTWSTIGTHRHAVSQRKHCSEGIYFLNFSCGMLATGRQKKNCSTQSSVTRTPWTVHHFLNL